MAATDKDRPGTATATQMDTLIAATGGSAANPSSSFTRPADTTAYASGDLVANSVTAGSVVPLSWAGTAVSCLIRRARLFKSTTTATLATFRLHVYAASPTPANGDNAAWSTNGAATYLGSIDLDMTSANARVFTDGLYISGVPAVGSDFDVTLAAGTTVYGLLEARAAYVPANAEVFTVILEMV